MLTRQVGVGGGGGWRGSQGVPGGWRGSQGGPSSHVLAVERDIRGAGGPALLAGAVHQGGRVLQPREVQVVQHLVGSGIGSHLREDTVS